MRNEDEEEETVGVYVDFTLHAVCDEEDMLGRLNRLRTKAAELPVASVSPVTKIDPVYNYLVIMQLRAEGLPIPPMVEKRLEDEQSADVSSLALKMSMFAYPHLKRNELMEFISPGVDMANNERTYWNPEDYPENIRIGWTLTYQRPAFLLELANVLLRYGYALTIDPGEGCEPVLLMLSTYRTDRTPIWTGYSSCKTQYAKKFKKMHEVVCKILDFAKEEGILYHATDSCEFYEYRDWKTSMKVVKKEVSSAREITNLLMMGMESLMEAGLDIECLSAPATGYVDALDGEDADGSEHEDKDI